MYSTLPRHAVRVRLTDPRGLVYEFPTVAAASAFVGCMPQSLSNVINGHRNGIKGFLAEQVN